MKAHLITMQYPDFILRQQQSGEAARQAIATILFAQIRIFSRESTWSSVGLLNGRSDGANFNPSAAAGVVSSPFSPFRAYRNFPRHEETLKTDGGSHEELELLNYIFVSFDKLSKSFGVDKIKNVGQAWVGACGLDDNADDVVGESNTPTAGAQNILKFAVACVEKLSTMPTGKLDVRISIGIGTETTVAGVFGSGIYQYEAVGDAVTEAHILSTLTQNSIAVAQSTLRFVGQHFFVSRFAFQECYPMPRISNHHGYTSQYYRCFAPERTQDLPAIGDSSVMLSTGPQAGSQAMGAHAPGLVEDQSANLSYAGWSKFSYDFDLGSSTLNDFGGSMGQVACANGFTTSGFQVPYSSSAGMVTSLTGFGAPNSTVGMGMSLPGGHSTAFVASAAIPMPASTQQHFIPSTGGPFGAPFSNMPIGSHVPIASSIAPQVTTSAAARGTVGMVSSDMMAAAARGQTQGIDDGLQKKLKSLIQLGKEIKQNNVVALQGESSPFVLEHPDPSSGRSSGSQTDTVRSEDADGSTECVLGLFQRVLRTRYFEKTVFYDNLAWFVHARRSHPGITEVITRAHATSHVTLVAFAIMSIGVYISTQGMLSEEGYFGLPHQWVVFPALLLLLVVAGVRAIVHYRRARILSAKKDTQVSSPQSPGPTTDVGQSDTLQAPREAPSTAANSQTAGSDSRSCCNMECWMLRHDHIVQLTVLAGFVVIFCAEQIFLDIVTVESVSGYDDVCIENRRNTHWIVTGVGLYLLTLSDLRFDFAVGTSFLLISFWVLCVTLSWRITSSLSDEYTVTINGDTVICEDIQPPLKIWIIDISLLLFNIMAKYDQELAMMQMSLSQRGMQISQEKTQSQSETLSKAFRILFPSHVFRLCVEDRTSDEDEDGNTSGTVDSQMYFLRDSITGDKGNVKSSLFKRRIRGLLVESVHGATVLVINMIPLQSLVGLLQPTDLFTVFATLASVCDEAVENYGGKRARIVGNMFVAVFGLPESDSENDDTASSEAIPQGVKAGYKAFDEIYSTRIPSDTDKASKSRLKERIALVYQKTHSAWSAMSATNSINRQLHELSKEFGVDIASSATLHTGAVLSGLLGSRAVRYDVYGPTVYQAEEMASLVRRPRLIALSDTAAQSLLDSCTWFAYLFRERWPINSSLSKLKQAERDISSIPKSYSMALSAFATVLHWDPNVDKAIDSCAAVAAETVKFDNVILPTEVSSFFVREAESNTGDAVQGGLTPIPSCEKLPLDELEPLLHYLLPMVDDREEVLTICIASSDRPKEDNFSTYFSQQPANYNEIELATVSSGSSGLFGIHNRDLVGKRLFDIVHPFDQDAFCQALDALTISCTSQLNFRESTQRSKLVQAPTSALLVVPLSCNGHNRRLYDSEEEKYVEWWEIASWTAPVAVCIQHRVVCASGERGDLMRAPSVVQWRWASTTLMQITPGVIVALTRRVSPELAAELSSFVPAEDSSEALYEYSERLYGEGTLTSQGFVPSSVECKEDTSMSGAGRQGSQKRKKKKTDRSEHSRVSFSDFKLLQGLGAGQYATVYLALHKPSGNVFAIKRFDASQVRSKSLQAELKALSARQRHPNVVDFVCCLTGNDEIWLVMEHVRGIPLDILLRYKGKLDVNTVKQLLAEVLLGVGFLHSLGILHRDVAEKNIMITREGHVKIIDFGLSVLVNPLQTPTEVAASMNTPAAFVEGSSTGSVNDTSSVDTNETSQGSGYAERKQKKEQPCSSAGFNATEERDNNSKREGRQEGGNSRNKWSEPEGVSQGSHSKSGSDSWSYARAFEKAANVVSKDSPFSENLVALLQSLIPAPDNRVVKRLFSPQRYRLSAVSIHEEARAQNEGAQSSKLAKIPEREGESNEPLRQSQQPRRTSFNKSTTVLLLTLDDGGQFIQHLIQLYASQHASRAGIPAHMVSSGNVPEALIPEWLPPDVQRRDVATGLRSKSVHLVKVTSIAEAEATLKRDAPIFDAFIIHCLGHPEMVLPALQMRYVLSQEISAASQLPVAIIFTAPAGEWQQLFAQKYAADGAAMCIAMPFTRQSLRAVCLLARHTSEQREAALRRVKGMQGGSEGDNTLKSGNQNESPTFADSALHRMGQASTQSYVDNSRNLTAEESGVENSVFAGLYEDSLAKIKAATSSRGPIGSSSVSGSGGSSKKSSSEGTSSSKRLLQQLEAFHDKSSSSSSGASNNVSDAENTRRASYFQYINTNERRSSPFVTVPSKLGAKPAMKFGVANALKPTVNTIAGTPHYMAPETLMRKTSFASDYFAVGVLAFRLLSGYYPFSGSTRRQVQENVMKNKVNWSKLPPGLPHDLVQLLHALLHPDPAHRLGGREGVRSIMSHAFFTDVDWANVSYSSSPLANLASNLDPFGEEFADGTPLSNISISTETDNIPKQSFDIPVTSACMTIPQSIPESKDDSSTESSASRKSSKPIKDKDIGSGNSEESLNAQVAVVGSGGAGMVGPSFSAGTTHIVSSAPVTATMGGDTQKYESGYEAGYRKAMEDAQLRMKRSMLSPSSLPSTQVPQRTAGGPPSVTEAGTSQHGYDLFGPGAHYATGFSPKELMQQQSEASLSDSKDFQDERMSGRAFGMSGSMGNQMLASAYSQQQNQSNWQSQTSGLMRNQYSYHSTLSQSSENVPAAAGRTKNMAPLSHSLQFASADQSQSGTFGNSYQQPHGFPLHNISETGENNAYFREDAPNRSGMAPFDRKTAFPSYSTHRTEQLPQLPNNPPGLPQMQAHESGTMTSGQFPDLSSTDFSEPYGMPRMLSQQMGSNGVDARASGSIEVPVLPPSQEPRINRPFGGRPPVPARQQPSMVSGGRGITRLSSETSYREDDES